MKNKIITFFTALSLLLLSNACNDERLDILPLNILTSEQIFQSEAGIEAYMASLYDQLPAEDFRFRNWGQDLANYTDESVTNSSVEGVGIPNGTQLGWWGYASIRNVNALIENLPGAKVSEAKKRSLLGEAKFIRAFYYFGLAKRYGGVPIIKEVQNFTGNNIAELQVPRNTEQEVWDFIATDLDEAAAALPATHLAGRATQTVAMALKSRAMLYAASVARYGTVMLNGLVGIPASEAGRYWQAAFDAAKKVIDSGQHALYNKNTNKELNFTELFLDVSNPEAIFSVYYQYPDKIHRFDRGNLPFSIRAPSGYSSGTGPYLELVEQFEYVDGSPGKLKLTNPDGTPIFYAHPTDLFRDKDPRLLATVILPFAKFRGHTIDVQAGLYDQGTKWEAGDETSLYNPSTHQPDKTSGTIRIVGVNGFGSGSVEKTQTGFYLRKYLNANMEQSRADNSDQPWIVLRYAEVLLNYAEAAAELNKTADARWAINQVRERAGIRQLEESEVTLEKVRHERLVELAFENHRWWDYRRWRIADKILNNVRFTALRPYYDLQAKAYRFETAPAGRWPKTFEAKAYYERIDPGEIAKNPNLIQNPNF